MPRRVLTRHAKRRMRKRGIGSASVHRASFGTGKYLGGRKYKAVKKIGDKEVVVIYKKVGGKKIVLSTWSNHANRDAN